MKIKDCRLRIYAEAARLRRTDSCIIMAKRGQNPKQAGEKYYRLEGGLQGEIKQALKHRGEREDGKKWKDKHRLKSRAGAITWLIFYYFRRYEY